MKKQTNQRGAAIIVALFVTALVAAAAIAMIEQVRIDTHRTVLLQNANQANLYAQGSITWAREQLINNWKQQQSGKVIDHTPIVSTVNTENEVKIVSTLYDAQGKLNLNNLSDTQFQEVFTRLIQLVAPDIDPATGQAMTLAVVDWITPGISNSPYDQYYAKRAIPYRAPHQLMVSVSELRLIKGMTATLYTKLMPYVTVLPDKTQFNINSVPIPVIMSFAPTITFATAKSLDALRHQSPFANLDMLGNFTTVKSSPLGQSGLTVTSRFFLLKTNVTIAKQTLTLYTLLLRLLKNNEPVVVIVWQSKGTL